MGYPYLLTRSGCHLQMVPKLRLGLGFHGERKWKLYSQSPSTVTVHGKKEPNLRQCRMMQFQFGGIVFALVLAHEILLKLHASLRRCNAVQWIIPSAVFFGMSYVIDIFVIPCLPYPFCYYEYVSQPASFMFPSGA